MIITVREAARLLETDEQAIYRLITDGSIPVHKIRDQHRFNRDELLEWAIANGMSVSVSGFSAPESVAPPVGFAYALSRGGVHDRTEGGDRESVLAAIVKQLPLSEADRELSLEVAIARGATAWTCAGDGIVVPHARVPVIVELAEPSITLSHVLVPLQLLTAKEGLIGSVFSIVAPTVRTHLYLLSRLAAALHDPEFRDAVIRRAPNAIVLSNAERLEGSFTPPPPASSAAR